MPHGEGEHGCAQGDPCRLGHEGTATHLRRHGLSHPGEQAAGRAVERAEDEAGVPRQRGVEPAHPAVEPPPARGCRSDLAGWAGAHQHGAVRPRSRATRRERPPRRWC
ncbi:hypothetical protein [Micromonospora sp. DT31]|uniref:hypothetical protein n=1 Tax=Micromonospora sp. DT31 TaxID=3393434 RepID=UPI003CF7F353